MRPARFCRKHRLTVLVKLLNCESKNITHSEVRMTQIASSELVGTLEKAKGHMMESIQHAGQAGQWDRAQWMIQKAKDLDEMINGLRQNGTGHAPLRPSSAPVQTTPPKYAKLPYYFTESNKLVKVGPSRDGSTYQHRVTRQH